MNKNSNASDKPISEALLRNFAIYLLLRLEDDRFDRRFNAPVQFPPCRGGIVGNGTFRTITDCFNASGVNA